MKLGDNMTMEAYSAWSSATPRKCRPPKIGDIPKHSAVDEESPESSTKNLTVSTPNPAESMLDIPAESSRNIVFPLGSTSTISEAHSPLSKFESRKNPLEKDIQQYPSVTEPRMRNPPRDVLTPYHPGQRDFKNPFAEFGYPRQKNYGTRTPSPEYPRPLTELEEPRSRIRIRLSSREEPTRVTVKSPSDEAHASPKFSTSLEEAGDREILAVRKDSALFLEDPEGVPVVYELLRSRAPRIVSPRRESSGYASNLGTFDEDRRNSSSSPADALQDFSVFLKEGRRSSTKRISSRIGVVRGEENLTEESSNYPAERMPTTEAYRKISSAGLEMPNIEEVKEVLREEVSSKQDDLGRICSIVERINVEDVSTRCRSPEKQLECPISCNSPQDEISVKRDFQSAAKTYIPTKRQQSSQAVADATVHSQPASMQSTRNSLNSIVHQQNVPFLASKGVQYSSAATRTSKPEPANREPDQSAVHDDVADASLPLIVNTRAKSESPKSGKVYQLLSTKSEDRSESVPRLADRRVPLPISRLEDRFLPKVQTAQSKEFSSSSSQSLAKYNLRGTIKATGGIDCSPLSKSSGSETGTSPKFLGDTSNVSSRPIYPDCLYSPYGSPQGSPRNRRRPLRESRRVSIDNRHGGLQLNQYKLLDNIGQGAHGIVKLVYNEEDERHYAMKILSKRKLMQKAGIFGRMAPARKGTVNPLVLPVYREIALLKKLDHPNVVKLLEVLDDPDEDDLYLVFELVEKGEVLKVPTDTPLDEETARKNFRDVVMGVEYLHYQRIVHRDIKPSNLLVDSDGRVKIADLGVSAELRAPGELLSGVTGTPAFSAPETTAPGARYAGTLCDIWSMGATLYSLVVGQIPWVGDGTVTGLQAAIRAEPLEFPEWPKLSNELEDLISKMLVKEPTERITLPEIKQHPWLTNHGVEPLPSEIENCRLHVTVTDEEVERVVTRAPKLDTLILVKHMIRQHSFQNPYQSTKGNRAAGSDPSSNVELSSPTRTVEQRQPRPTARSTKSERFQRSGRSNSAPDSYNWQTNGRQVSVDTPLEPVTEASNQESEVERR